MQRPSPEDLGDPALRVGGLRLWIHGRQLPDAIDYYDGNWLRVTAHCGASGASVWAQGTILMTTDIERFAGQCKELLRGTTTEAALDPLEPQLRVTITAVDRLGHLRARVEITPDHISQSHTVEFEIDQSYLPDLIDQCSLIPRDHPIRDRGDDGGSDQSPPAPPRSG